MLSLISASTTNPAAICSSGLVLTFVRRSLGSERVPVALGRRLRAGLSGMVVCPHHRADPHHLCRDRPGGRSGGIRLSLAHSRKPPRKAFALWPARHRGGSASSFLTLPPPITVSSGRSAAVKRSTTSATRRRHFFLPLRSNPARPTYLS